MTCLEKGLVGMKCPGSFHEFLSSIIASLEKESAMSLTHVLLDLPVLQDPSVGSEELAGFTVPALPLLG